MRPDKALRLVKEAATLALPFLHKVCYKQDAALCPTHSHGRGFPPRAETVLHFERSGGTTTMAKAIWNGQTLAESETYETVEGNIYFPDESVRREFFKASSTTSSCTWKGQARYYTIVVDGQENPDAAWYYPDPKPAARKVKHHVAFWRGVEIIK